MNRLFAIFCAAVLFALAENQAPAQDAELHQIIKVSKDDKPGRKVDERQSELSATLNADILQCLLKYSCIQGTNTAFNADDIIKLQSFKSSDVLDLMDRVLSVRAGNEIAATEVLFAIGTADSRSILDKHLLATNTDIRIAPHEFRTLNSTLRTAFAYQYTLKPLGADLDISLKAKPGSRTNTVDFTISLRNMSQRIYSIYKPSFHLGRCLTLISDDEKLAVPVRTPDTEAVQAGPESSCISMVPGELVALKFAGTVERMPPASTNGTQEASLILDCGDSVHQLPRNGKYRIYATYDYLRNGAEPTADFWEGRIISDPVEVELTPAPVQQPTSANNTHIGVSP